MRVLLSTYGSRGDVEPLVGLAVQLRALGAEARVCAPPDEEFAELLAGVGVPLVPFGHRCARSWVRPSAAEELTRRVAELLAAQFDTVAVAAQGCDVLLAAGCVAPSRGRWPSSWAYATCILVSPVAIAVAAPPPYAACRPIRR